VTQSAEHCFGSAFPGFNLDPWPGAAKPQLVGHPDGTTEVVPFLFMVDRGDRALNFQQDPCRDSRLGCPAARKLRAA
jgi:hypothetical protein